jgi:hypothetical protein
MAWQIYRQRKENSEYGTFSFSALERWFRKQSEGKFLFKIDESQEHGSQVLISFDIVKQ